MLGCPENFSLNNDQCYGFFVNKTQKLKYVEAKEECKRYLRYNLASVFSREETKYLGNMTVQTNRNIGKKSFNFPWIGLHKNAYSPEGNSCVNKHLINQSIYVLKSISLNN